MPYGRGMGAGNAEIARRIFDRVWSEGDFTGLEEALAGPFTYHVRDVAREMDLGAMRDIVARWRTAFPDLRFEIDDLVADESVVALRARLIGTHEGVWGDRAPTGNRIEVDHMFFLRFDGGRLVEVFEMLDRDALRDQLEPTADEER